MLSISLLSILPEKARIIDTFLQAGKPLGCVLKHLLVACDVKIKVASSLKLAILCAMVTADSGARVVDLATPFGIVEATGIMHHDKPMTFLNKILDMLVCDVPEHLLEIHKFLWCLHLQCNVHTAFCRLASKARGCFFFGCQ